jgi:hypothetical protein
MAKTRDQIVRSIEQARRHANEPCGSYEDRHVEKDILREYERDLRNYDSDYARRNR